jgi:hypothetical protein
MTRLTNPCACRPTERVNVLHDHLFEASGRRVPYGCCRGRHEACARCACPADEHPSDAAVLATYRQRRVRLVSPRLTTRP